MTRQVYWDWAICTAKNQHRYNFFFVQVLDLGQTCRREAWCRCETNNLSNDEWGLFHPLCSLLPLTLLIPLWLQDPLGPFFFPAVLRPPIPRDCRFPQILLFSGLCFLEIANHSHPCFAQTSACRRLRRIPWAFICHTSHSCCRLVEY